MEHNDQYSDSILGGIFFLGKLVKRKERTMIETKGIEKELSRQARVDWICPAVAGKIN